MKKEEVGTFKIMQITDIHLGEAENTDWGPLQDVKTFQLLDRMLSLLEPSNTIDLIVLGGDQVTANNCLHNCTEYFRMLGTFLTKYGIPWISVVGNHDDMNYEVPEVVQVPPPNTTAYTNSTQQQQQQQQTTIQQQQTTTTTTTIPHNYTRDDILKIDMTEFGDLSFTKIGPTDVYGSSNYYIDVVFDDDDSNDNHNDKDKDKDDNDNDNDDDGSRNNGNFPPPPPPLPVPVLQIYVFDSGGGSINEMIDESQIEWFQQIQREQRRKYYGGHGGNNNNNNNRRRKIRVPAVAFQHIPTRQYVEEGGGTHSHCIGSHDDSIEYIDFDAGIIDALLNASSSISDHQDQGQDDLGGDDDDHDDDDDDDDWGFNQFLFLGVGHNHGNDYCCSYTRRGRRQKSLPSPSTPSTSSSSSLPQQQPNITLCYGRHSGYGGYGQWQRGVRMYEIKLLRTTTTTTTTTTPSTSTSTPSTSTTVPTTETTTTTKTTVQPPKNRTKPSTTTTTTSSTTTTTTTTTTTAKWRSYVRLESGAYVDYFDWRR